MGVADENEEEEEAERNDAGETQRGDGLEAILARQQVREQAEVPGKGKQAIQ